jgi:hypothetical protein
VSLLLFFFIIATISHAIAYTALRIYLKYTR